jgi:hypothetical protein
MIPHRFLESILEDIMRNGQYDMLVYIYQHMPDIHDKRRLASTNIMLILEMYPEQVLDITNSHVRCFKFLFGFVLTTDIINCLFLCSSGSCNKYFLQTILKYKPNININDGIALVKACKRGNLDIVKLLFDRGISRNTTPNVLTLKSVQSNVKLFKLCVVHGVEIISEVRDTIYNEQLSALYSFVPPKPKPIIENKPGCCIS